MDGQPDGLLGRLVGRRLTAVVFSMDHLILWFDGDPRARGNVTLHFDVFPRVERDGVLVAEPDAGYGDAVRSLVPQQVTEAVERTGEGVVISFTSGRLVLRPPAEEMTGPEIAMLTGFEDHAWTVWRPGEGVFDDRA